MPGKLKTRTETYIGNFVIDRGPHLAEFRKNKGILTAPFMRESTFFKEKAKGYRTHLLTDGWHLYRCFWPGSETLIPKVGIRKPILVLVFFENEHNLVGIS